MEKGFEPQEVGGGGGEGTLNFVCYIGAVFAKRAGLPGKTGIFSVCPAKSFTL